MPDGKVPRYYWDSCVFLSAIERVPERIAVLERLLDDADVGRIEIYTSTVSITEIAFAKFEKDQRQLDPAVAEKVAELWAATSPVKVVEFHELIAYAARDLVRHAMPSDGGLKPMDAIHLATAIQAQVDSFQTYDKKLIGFGSRIGLKIEAPYSPVLPFAEGLKQ